jgi:hypothetical protein
VGREGRQLVCRLARLALREQVEAHSVRRYSFGALNRTTCGEWNGKPSCWKDTRWTGVLEKREGRWVIVQMHFSFAKDKVLQECPGAMAK